MDTNEWIKKCGKQFIFWATTNQKQRTENVFLNHWKKVQIHCYRLALSFQWASIILDFKMELPNVRKNFTCEICRKGYSTINSKERHIRIVHGEVKKFECNVCGKTFGLKYELRSHIETNRKAKHQKCKFCTKKFSTFGRLSKHITKIHKSHRKYKCDSC